MPLSKESMAYVRKQPTPRFQSRAPPISRKEMPNLFKGSPALALAMFLQAGLDYCKLRVGEPSELMRMREQDSTVSSNLALE